MKKIIVFIILLIMPISVRAASLSATCNGGAPGAVVTCTIKVSGTKVAGVQTNLGISSNATISGLTRGSDWSGQVSTSKIAFYRSTGISSSTVATLQVKLSSSASTNATLTLSGIIISDENGNTENLSAKTVAIPLLSNNNNLSNLHLNNAKINFSKSITNYSVTIDAPSTTITAVKENDTASFVSGFGSRTAQLDYGNNSILIKVKAASGAIKTYTITVIRPDKRDKNGNLKSLKVGDNFLVLKGPSELYKVNVASDVSTIEIKAVTEFTKAVLMPKYGNRTEKLNYGDNEILVKVLAENQSVTVYKIIVNRKDVRDDNNKLKSVKLSEGRINFNPEYTNYTVSVGYDITRINVSASASSENSKVDVETLGELVVGSNPLKINVTAENGSVRTYNINFVRLSEGEPVPSAEIKKIEIDGYDFKFDKNINSYYLQIRDVDTLDIKVEPLIEGTKVKIIGNEKLENNSRIVVLSISAEGEVGYYQITVHKVSAFTLFIAILGSIVVLFVLALLIMKNTNIKNMGYNFKKGGTLYD